MNQGRVLESMAGTFLPRMVPRDTTQPPICKRNEDLEGLLIPGSPLAEEGADGLGARLGHAHHRWFGFRPQTDLQK